ncbi:MAG: hypothetical protein QM501_02615, partial [Gimesia sp.]
MIKFKCPNCEKRFNLSDQYIGRTAKCNKCEHRFKIPDAKKSRPDSKSASLKKAHAVDEPEKKTRRPRWKPIALSFGLGLLVVCAFIFIEREPAENPESNPSQVGKKASSQ